jgi:two-component system, NtrC family, response regulator AtoC
MRKKILVCDDEIFVRKSLKLILDDTYDIFTAENGKSAITVIKNNPGISCVLLDIKMPELNGLELLKYMKDEKYNIPVVVITGYQSVEAAARSMQTGASYYITKPFKSETVINTVREAVSGFVVRN